MNFEVKKKCQLVMATSFIVGSLKMPMSLEGKKMPDKHRATVAGWKMERYDTTKDDLMQYICTQL